MISAYRPVPLKRNGKKSNQIVLNSCHLQALAEDLCCRKTQILKIQDRLMCVKQETVFDPPEDKINRKWRFTCNYSCTNACNTHITNGWSELPFKPLRYITVMTQVILSTYITFTASENIRACPELGPTTAVLHIRESGKD